MRISLCNSPQLHSSEISKAGRKKKFQKLESLCCAKQVNFAHGNTVSAHCNLNLDQTSNKTGDVISLIDSGAITRTVTFSRIAE
jgi:hypothetical protein